MRSNGHLDEVNGIRFFLSFFTYSSAHHTHNHFFRSHFSADASLVIFQLICSDKSAEPLIGLNADAERQFISIRCENA